MHTCGSAALSGKRPLAVGLTSYPALDEVLSTHAHGLREVLAGDFVGLYLLGSLAVGDFDLTSDVDFVVVVADELNDAAVRRVQAAHTDLIRRGDRWVTRLEYSLFPVAQLHQVTSPYGPHGERNDAPHRRLWYFNNGSPTLERSDHDNTLVTRWTLRYKSPVVLGPEPATFAPDVRANTLRREIRSSMLGWEQLVLTDPDPLDNRFHQVFLVLNNCRALQDLYEGRITSKLDGVTWARRHLDTEWQPLIEFCWQERQDTGIHISQPADRRAFGQTIEFMQYTARLAKTYATPAE